MEYSGFLKVRKLIGTVQCHARNDTKTNNTLYLNNLKQIQNDKKMIGNVQNINLVVELNTKYMIQGVKLFSNCQVCANICHLLVMVEETSQ